MKTSLGRRLWTAALTGIPFAIYKVGFGWYEHQHSLPAIGLAMMIWGAIDVVTNLLVVLFPTTLSWCLLSNIGRCIDRISATRIWEKILLAVDTTASFSIVSIMILLGRLPLEPELAALAWNLAVVGNVLSVGLEQLYRAIKER